jgi:hypothetical protein
MAGIIVRSQTAAIGKTSTDTKRCLAEAGMRRPRRIGAELGARSACRIGIFGRDRIEAWNAENCHADWAARVLYYVMGEMT